MGFDFNFAIYSFVALFVIVDPIVNVPIFNNFLHRFGDSTKAGIIRKSVFIAFVVLLLFTLSGQLIFTVLGLEMFAFRIAGGILLFIISMEMLFGRRSRTETSPEESAEIKDEADDLAVTPLAVPLLTGPGALTTGIVLFDSANSIDQKIGLFGAMGLVFILSYFILSRSERLFMILGTTGTKVIVRIFGLLLASISVQFVFNGIREAIQTFF